ncbi:MAG: pyrroloquinoline quinone-dependent dehydrogenase, partial [Candidatus Korobacteraceae bacterium]
MLVTSVAGTSQQSSKSWTDYGGGPDNSHYADIRQITKENVSQLKVAWTYPTQDNSSYYFNPIVVDNVMYVLARNTSLVALDATTGKEIWVHENLHGIAPRGINYWESADRKQRRLLFQINHTLQAIDARTGKSILTFGKDGFVDLRQGLGRDPKEIYRVQSNNPGKIFKNLILLGMATGEGYVATPGALRAFDVITGKLVWQFNTIPRPGEFGYDTWPKDAWKYIGGVNTWGEITVDEKRGIAYFPLGSPTYDFYGGDRHGENLFGNCLMALDARTGKRLWHFQAVHHDLWDYDLTAAPQLITVTHNGKKIDAVAQATKQGFVYTFDRVTGQPLFPIEERPFPTQTDVPGEKVWPTQPIPKAPPPFARQSFTEDDINLYFLTPEEREAWKKLVRDARNEGLFTPPAFKRNTVAMPGDRGGAIWGMTSSDPNRGLLYVASIDVPFFIRLEEELPQSFQTVTILGQTPRGAAGPPGRRVYLQNCQGCHGADRAGQGGIPSLQGIVSRLTPEGVKDAVRNGRGEMPPFATMDATELEALVAYLGNPEGLPVEASPTRPSTPLGGPVVASGGAPAAREYVSSLPPRPAEYGMSGGPSYPAGTEVPPRRLYTGFDAHRQIITPPWSSLTAYDMNKGTIKWQIPLGEEPRAVAEGIRNTGIMQDQRGVVVTSTGLLFSATTDGYVRALDAETGKILWAAQLPAASYGLPAMYEVNGKAFVVIAAAASRNSFGLPPT